MRKGIVLAVMACLSCGGGGPTAPQPAAQPPPTTLAPSPIVELFSGSWSVARGGGSCGDFSLKQSGVLTITADWGSGDNAVWVYFTYQDCSTVSQLLTGGCTIVASATSNSAKPQVLTAGIQQSDLALPAPGPGARRACVYNEGPGSESGTMVARLDTSAAPPPTPPPTTMPSPPPTTQPSQPTCNGETPPATCDVGNGPPPPTAKCNDGLWSCSQNRSGTCSGHGGVACYVCPGPLC